MRSINISDHFILIDNATKALLYPQTSVVIISPTREKVKEVIQTFKNAIPNSEIASIQDGLISLKNKSTIHCVTGNKASQNIRGRRSTIICSDCEDWECVDKKVLDEVLSPFIVK